MFIILSMVDGFDFFGLSIDTTKIADCAIQRDSLEIQMKKEHGDFVRNGTYHFQKTSKRKNEMIHDEFTDLKISRQRKYQLRKTRDGQCRICGDMASPFSRGYCKYHRRKKLESRRRYYREHREQ